MNERIQELYKQATGKDWKYDFDPVIAEEFALLIIEECARIAEQASGYRLPSSTYGDLIRKFEPLKEEDYTVRVK